jgi:DNA-binding NtrC family response regulator
MCNDNALSAQDPRGSLCVLVVEDSFDLRFTLAEWLRNHKYTVYEAANAEEAKVLLASAFVIDLVITDIEMPGPMNGLALVDHIQARNPQQNIIVVSGNDKYMELKERGLAFFRKPYDLREISSYIETNFKNKMRSE